MQPEERTYGWRFFISSGLATLLVIGGMVALAGSVIPGDTLLALVDWLVVWAAVSVFGLVTLLLLGSAVRFRPTATRSRRAYYADIGWTLLPALLTAAALVLVFQAVLAG